MTMVLAGPGSSSRSRSSTSSSSHSVAGAVAFAAVAATEGTTGDSGYSRRTKEPAGSDMFVVVVLVATVGRRGSSHWGDGAEQRKHALDTESEPETAPQES